jgi:hypothetical protein
MTRIYEVSDSIVVAVDPQTAYDAVSDVTQMGRWSPENRGARLVQPAPKLQVGSSFVGDNQRGLWRWKTTSTVTGADPGRRFAFRVHAYHAGPLTIRTPIAEWEYRFEPVDGGTRVTEIWRDGRTRWPDALVRVFDPIATRRRSFAEIQRGNIRRTLHNLAAALEA